MDATEAINIAKTYVARLFEADRATNVGLEELSFDDLRRTWSVTIGFSRPWDKQRNSSISSLVYDRWGSEKPMPRTFKTVEINDSDGKILGMTHRPIAA